MISDEDANRIGVSYFPPFVAKNLTVGIVREACKALEIAFPKKMNKQALLTHLGRQLFQQRRVKVPAIPNFTRDQIVFDL